MQQVFDHKGNELISVVCRVVECDDGVTRLDPVMSGEIVKLSDDTDRNRFVIAWLTRSSLKSMGISVQQKG